MLVKMSAAQVSWCRMDLLLLFDISAGPVLYQWWVAELGMSAIQIRRDVGARRFAGQLGITHLAIRGCNIETKTKWYAIWSKANMKAVY